VLFYHGDHLGSATLITDSQGEVVERTSYYPFGLERSRQQADVQVAYRFTGQEWDQEIALYDYGARFYDPVVGRFVSVDPLYVEQPEHEAMNPQTLNLYAYTLNNPLRYIDPDGTRPQSPQKDQRQQRMINRARNAAQHDRDRIMDARADKLHAKGVKQFNKMTTELSRSMTQPHSVPGQVGPATNKIQTMAGVVAELSAGLSRISNAVTYRRIARDYISMLPGIERASQQGLHQWVTIHLSYSWWSPVVMYGGITVRGSGSFDPKKPDSMTRSYGWTYKAEPHHIYIPPYTTFVDSQGQPAKNAPAQTPSRD
jgi:RHS repeat-associated protein